MRSLIRRAILGTLLALCVLCAGAQSVAVNDAGTWRTATEVHVNDAGTWRQITEIYVNDAGTWRLVFSGATVAIANATWTDQAATPANAGVDFSLESGAPRSRAGGRRGADDLRRHHGRRDG